MSRETHGKARAGLITASVARTVMSGSDKAWETLAASLWADDGAEFAAPSYGARRHGLVQEKVAIGKFWELHPELDIEPVDFLKFKRKGYKADHPYRLVLGISPDMVLIRILGRLTRRVAGGEIKSPVEEGTYRAYVADIARGNIPVDHIDQVRFSIFVAGLPWYFITHHGENYKELYVEPDDRQREWERRFLPRLDAFIKFYLEGQKPERDKLDPGGLAGLLGM